MTMIFNDGSKTFLTRLSEISQALDGEARLVYNGEDLIEKINQIIRYLNAMKIQYTGKETDEDYKRFKEFVYKVE